MKLIAAPGGEASGANWQRVTLGSSNGSNDPNSLLSGLVTETGGSSGSTTLTLDTTSAAAVYNNPTSGLYYYFNNLTDNNGDALSWSDTIFTNIFFEVITPPASNTRFIMYAGLTSDTSSDVYHVGTGYRRATTDPGRVHYFNSAITASNNLSMVHSAGCIFSSSDVISNFSFCQGIDVNFDGINLFSSSDNNRRVPNSLSDPVSFFVLFGCTGTGASSNPTIEFRLWRMITKQTL